MLYRFTLEKYRGRNNRYTCPQCGHFNEFTRYIDTSNGQHIAGEVGRCNRASNCGYHYTPKQFFADYPSFDSVKNHPTTYSNKHKASTAFDSISQNIFEQTLCDYEENNFIKFLKLHFEINKIKNVIRQYFIGTWTDKRTIFWQIDTQGIIRTGKLISYNVLTGRREKMRKPSWVHYELQRKKSGSFNYPECEDKHFQLKQCFFGEHLLNLEPKKSIGVVESEKTAAMASLVIPELLWIATGGCGNLNLDSLVRLSTGRPVIFFPDSSKYNYWSAKVSKAIRIFNSDFRVSDLLEIRLTEQQKREDYDIADFLLTDMKSRN